MTMKDATIFNANAVSTYQPLCGACSAILQSFRKASTERLSSLKGCRRPQGNTLGSEKKWNAAGFKEVEEIYERGCRISSDREMHSMLRITEILQEPHLGKDKEMMMKQKKDEPIILEELSYQINNIGLKRFSASITLSLFLL